MKQQIYITGLYLSLSRDDEQQGESSSISTQRQMLTQFCNEQGLRIYDEYVDDWYSEYGKDRCSIHYINYETVYDIVLLRLQYWIAQAQTDENKLLERLLKNGDKQRAAEIGRAKKDIAKAEKRLKELDSVFAKLYEDRACDKVTERNYMMLSGKYQDEQLKLESEIVTLKDKLRETVESKDNAEKWLSLIRKYTNLTMLTAPILNELIEKIVVHEATKDKDGKRIQKIEIYYRFVGKIDD